jgi:alpha-beta hydrolase superfamily lysophospholipase
MPTRSPSLWRVRIGIVLAVLCGLLAVLTTSALPVMLDVRPALLGLGAAAAVVLGSARSRLPGRRGRALLLAVASLAGFAALWAACDLWVFYRTEEVRFTGEKKGVELAGTLYLPRSGVRHAAIVLVHGSGPEPRQEYRFYARRFARAGLVALAYDKRGSGASGGDSSTASYQQLAADAVGAVKMLRSRPEVDAARVGIWGLSEGEWVGTLAAVQSTPAFLVLVSPSAMTPSDQVRHETRANVLRAGFGEAAARRAAGLYARLAQFQRTGADRAELNRQLAAARSEPWFEAARYLEESVPEYDRVLALSWFPAWRTRMDFDPLALCSRLQCPVLAQVGGDDPKNDGQAALDRLRAAFARGGNTRFTGILYPSGGHGMVVWPLPGHVPPPWFAQGYLQDQLTWVLRAVGER